MRGSVFRIVFRILAGEFESEERFPGFVLLLETGFSKNDVGKNSLNDGRPEMNAEISRKKNWFRQEDRRNKK